MSPRSNREPVFTALSAEECRSVLERNHVGRLAFLNGRVVEIEPVHYVATDRWIFARSAEGTKLEAFAHNPYVAFEVDEVDGPFDWTSVVVHGTIYLMLENGERVDERTFDRALNALRSFMPQTLSEGDPTPFRATIYGLHVDSVVGRAAEQLKPPTHRRRKVLARPKRRRPRLSDGT